jgi:hypothetical protein
MNAPTPYKSARLYDSDESTVETVLSTVEDKKEEEEKDKFTACSTCSAKYKFLPISKVPEDIFPPQQVGAKCKEKLKPSSFTIIDTCLEVVGCHPLLCDVGFAASLSFIIIIILIIIIIVVFIIICHHCHHRHHHHHHSLIKLLRSICLTSVVHDYDSTSKYE